MGITVKHGKNGSAILGAFGGGLGKRQAEDARLAAQLGAQEQADKRQMGLHTASTNASRAQIISAPSGTGSARLPSTSAPSTRVVQQAPDRQRRVLGSGPRESWDERLARRDAAQAYSEERMAASNAEFRGDTTEQPALQYSDKQRQEYNARWEAYQNAVSSGDFTDDELIEAKKSLMQMDMGMEPTRRMEKPEATPEDLLAQRSVAREDGSIVGLKADGTPFVLQEAPGKVNTKDEKSIIDGALGFAQSEDETGAIDQKKLSTYLKAHGREDLMARFAGDGSEAAAVAPVVEPKKRLGGGVIDAVKEIFSLGGATTETFNAEDQQALTWAESNPDDARSKQIIESLKSK